MSGMTASPLQSSSTAVSGDLSDSMGAISPTDSSCTTAAPEKEFGQTTHSLDIDTNDYADIASISNEKHEWRETCLRWGTLSGIFAFLVAVLTIIASLGVLVVSNGEEVDTWSTPPSTYIAIFTAIGNMAMRYAAIQGIIVAWWTKAIRGSSISELHYNWRAGTSFHGAFIAGRHMGWLGIASIFSCVVILLDGPLIQRSSTVASTSIQGPSVELKYSMVPEIPRAYTGFWVYSKLLGPNVRWDNTFNDTIPSTNGTIPNNIFSGGLNILAPLVPQWAAEKPLSNSVSGCSGTCTAQLVAPALAATSCVKYERPVDYKSPWTVVNPFEQSHAPPLGHESFIVSAALDVSGENEKINIVTAYTPSTNCTGTITYDICSLEAAVGEYNITITDNRITLDTADSPKIIRMANNTRVNRTELANGYHPSTLAGVVDAAYLIWNSAIFTAKANGTTTVTGSGTHANLQFQRGTYNEQQCPAYRDPRVDFVASLNRWMVTLGSAAARGVGLSDTPLLDTIDSNLEVNATTTGHVTGSRSVFRTDYAFFVGAAIVELVCICLIAPTYWGWWRIGRIVSFSPLEIAKAFDAPILKDVNSNSTGREIAKAYNEQQIQYGSMAVDGKGTKLAFSRPDSVIMPQADHLVDV